MTNVYYLFLSLLSHVGLFISTHRYYYNCYKYTCYAINVLLLSIGIIIVVV